MQNKRDIQNKQSVQDKQSKKERSEQTMAAVLAVAERHFADLGYALVSTDALVQEIGFTRGALYHHFGNKQGLFEAVVERIHQKAARAIQEKSAHTSDVWQGFVKGCLAWLDVATDPATQRILLIDAPAVMGWKRWLELDAQYGSQLLTEGIEHLINTKVIVFPSKIALLHLLNGAMNQAALWVAQSPNPKQTRQEARKALVHLLNKLRD
jgi:AcrR family transcriptional regulator